MESATTKAVCADEEDVERMLPTLPLPLLIFFYRYRDYTGDRLFYPPPPHHLHNTLHGFEGATRPRLNQHSLRRFPYRREGGVFDDDFLLVVPLNFCVSVKDGSTIAQMECFGVSVEANRR